MPARRPLLALFALLGVVLGALLVGCGAGAAVSDASSSAAARPSSAAGADAPADGAACPTPSPTTPGARESKLPLRALCTLPREAAETWRKIASGAKLPYSRDGIVFGNFERLLPQHERGYYREYTVPTPGERDRGARRLVTGQSRELYYTGDHYRSFVVVDPDAAPR